MIMLQGWKMTKCLGYSMFHVRTFRGARSNAESVRLLLRVRGLRRMSAVNVHCSHLFPPAREGLAPPDSANTANLVVFAESGGAKDSVAPPSVAAWHGGSFLFFSECCRHRQGIYEHVV